MVDRRVVLNRLKCLEEYLDYLSGIKQYDEKKFISDPDIYLRYERALQLAIEAVIDIGNHIVADHRLRVPETNKDIFIILSEAGIIDPDLSERLAKIAGFRNILVHDYLDLDRKLEYKIITRNLTDIRDFMKTIVGYI